MPQLIKKGTEDVYRKSVEQEKGEGKPYWWNLITNFCRNATIYICLNAALMSHKVECTK